MNDEFLQQWRTIAAAWDPTGAFNFATASGAAASTDPSNCYAAAAEAFSAAVRVAHENASKNSADGAAQAAQRFAEFLRAHFNDLSAFSAIGPMREHQQRWERLTRANLQAEEARARLARLWSDALRESAQGFARRCVDPVNAKTPPASLYDQWIDCAEASYSRMAHSEAFCSTQAELLNALSALRRELQTWFELWAKRLDLPTRSELNSVHRELRSLRAQLGHAPPSANPTTIREPAADLASKRPSRPAAARRAKGRRSP